MLQDSIKYKSVWYLLLKEILRAAKALGVVLWKEKETERTYRNPRGAGQDENQESRPKQATTLRR